MYIFAAEFRYLFSRSLQPTPIFDVLSRQDGVDLPSLEKDRELTIMRVEDAMHPADSERVLDEGALPPVDEVMASGQEFYLLMRLSGEWTGISRQSLLEMLKSPTDTDLRDSLLPSLPHLYPDQALDIALRQIGDWPELPVVHRANVGMLVGGISLADILQAYRRTGKSRPQP